MNNNNKKNILSNNIKLINLNNVKIKKNNFEKICIYNCLNKFKNQYIVSYSNYISTLDKIINSCFYNIKKTQYNIEQTNICNINKNNIDNIKLFLKINNISHNLSIFKIDNIYIGFGGVYSIAKNQYSKNDKGIFCIYFDKDLNKISDKKLVIHKNISKKQNYSTAFDSNISFLKYNNKYYIYTRYNERKSLRKTQIFISNSIDKDYKYYNLVKFNEKNIYTYTQNIFIENNIFIGIFRYYINNNINEKIHNLYKYKIGILISHSFDGINFIIDNKQIFSDYNIYDLIVNNYKKEGNYNIFYKNNIKNNIFTKYKIRSGGYINYEQDDINNESEIKLEILNNINKILINYNIKKNGYIKLYFYDTNNKLKEEKKLEGNYINFKIDIKNTYKYIKILLFNSFIYQIL